jgi:hypothetical protein
MDHKLPTTTIQREKQKKKNPIVMYGTPISQSKAKFTHFKNRCMLI